MVGALEAIYERIEETVMRTAFEHCHRNHVQAARLLGISRNVLSALDQERGDRGSAVSGAASTLTSSSLASSLASSVRHHRARCCEWRLQVRRERDDQRQHHDHVEPEFVRRPEVSTSRRQVAEAAPDVTP